MDGHTDNDEIMLLLQSERSVVPKDKNELYPQTLQSVKRSTRSVLKILPLQLLLLLNTD